MSSRSSVVLASVLRVCRPLVRLLLRHGVAYPAFAQALKQVFLEAAVQELQASGKKQTDSAISLLSGVHRRDVRILAGRGGEALAMDEPMNMASQVVSRWLSDARFLDAKGRAKVLPRSGAKDSLEALVASISSDVRPRAVIDELVRLGLVEESAGGARLLAPGFVPRHGFGEMAALLADNLHDHAAAASLNLDSGTNHLEQSIFTDGLSEQSVHSVHLAAARAWRKIFPSVMREVEARYAQDQADHLPPARTHRVRFGIYFFEQNES